MNPASAQHAALRILLEDVDPLLQRAEEAAQTLTKVREELNVDLTTLGSLVQQSLDAQPVLLETGRKLSASASRIEAAMHSGPLPGNADAARAGVPLWVACTISATLSASLVTGTIWFGTRDVLEQARVGRALMSAWPSLDAATRVKVHEMIGKS
ncbi:MAG: hypothetical protein EOP82_12810 [Variovorax sp.]|nr:MAG: hypothetical protein EOP82_12810 [Variovorax sp.]